MVLLYGDDPDPELLEEFVSHVPWVGELLSPALDELLLELEFWDDNDPRSRMFSPDPKTNLRLHLQPCLKTRKKWNSFSPESRNCLPMEKPKVHLYYYIVSIYLCIRILKQFQVLTSRCPPLS